MASLIMACHSSYDPVPEGYMSITGKTMGTSYSAMYQDTANQIFTAQADSIFELINQSMSTYNDSSLISWMNRDSTHNILTVDKHFKQVYEKAKIIYRISNGAFNPAVMPLVNYWGFGYEDTPDQVDSNTVDSVLELLEFDAFSLSEAVTEFDTIPILTRSNPNAQLDFSAIAKGYAVDQFVLFLESKHIDNYMVEIGGEVRTSGLYGDKPWAIGIEEPTTYPEAESTLFQIIKLSGKSAATSGNYRNQRTIEGKIYAHTINPFTGYPELNEVLSATVLANDCAMADALATACMVLGKDKALELIKGLKGVEVFLIIHKDDDFKAVYTRGFEPYLEDN